MKTIHELTSSLQSKLAAGEVIERPAYIVKELLDNAIDAGAQTIRIDLEHFGLRKIMVTDDGRGMSREDLEICFRRHTTSKIKNEDDLNRITTMGFRGEALASIAAVAKLTINSREKNSVAGNQLILLNGEVEHISTKGMPVGTQIKVEDIFTTVPARHKFLKSEQTEYRHILDLIYKYALVFADIRFDIFHEGKQIHLLVASNQDERIKALLSSHVFTQLLPFQFHHEYVSLSGFTSKPQLTYKSTRNIHIFINNRAIQNAPFISVIKEIYGTLLEPTSYPHLILFITIPPYLVDVNVHPRKEEVHFVNSNLIFHVVQEGIKNALSSANLRYYDKRWSGDSKEFEAWKIREGNTKSYAANKLKKHIQEKGLLFHLPINQSFFQFHNVYITVPSEKGILLFDQHAVHERILYEEYRKTFEAEIQSKQPHALPSAVSINITPQEQVLLEEYQDLLNNIGFEFQLSEQHEVEFLSIPSLLQDRDLEVTLRGVLDELLERGERITFEHISHKMLAYLSCRSAVKAGDKLTQKQCKELIEKLKETENPFTCPHGRPTQLEIDLNYFHKLFKRK